MLYKCGMCGFVQMMVPDQDQLDGVAASESISQDVDRDTSPEDMRINEEIGFVGAMSRMSHVLRQDSIRINRTVGKLLNGSVESSPKFIDIGSGYGFHSFNLKKEFPNLDVHLLEISGERIESGIKEFKPNIDEFTFHHNILDDNFACEHFEKFEISFTFHVLEHVYDIKNFIKNMFAITKKGGTMILEVPNEDDELCLLSPNYREIIHFPAHVSCFTKDTLSRLVRESGIYEKVDMSFVPIQRYGFFNYIDWLRHNEKRKVLSDDYIPRENPSWIEKKWLETKEKNYTTDSIVMVLKKHDN